MDLDELKNFLRELSRESAKVILPFFGNQHDMDIESKADNTPVTQADRAAEEVMRRLINKHYPDHGIIGEEFGNENEDAEYVWVLDPIDGTKSFITNVPLFGSLVGLLHKGQPILGAIHQPVLGQLVVGDNDETTLNGAKVRARQCVNLTDATLLSSDFQNLNDPAHPKAEGWQKLVSKVKLARTWGDCYGYLLVASGWADIMVDPELSPWDLLPVIPIIRGAGAKITGWDGCPIDQAQSAVAAPSCLHDEIIRLLNNGD